MKLKPWLRLFFVAAPILLFAAPAAFDVASVKPAPVDGPSLRYRLDGSGFAMHGWLKHFVQQAYDVQDYQVAGGPAWASADWYEIQAKPAGAATKDQIREMLRRLLADRFQLKVHRETKMMQGYVLSVGKGGAKLPPPRMDVASDSTGSTQIGGGLIWARAATMATIAMGLRYELEQPVLDRTGIAGHYDLKLRFDEANSDLVDKAAAPVATPMGSVFTALHEVGLKLEAGKIPIEVIVIDSAERPSEN